MGTFLTVYCAIGLLLVLIIYTFCVEYEEEGYNFQIVFSFIVTGLILSMFWPVWIGYLLWLSCKADDTE